MYTYTFLYINNFYLLFLALYSANLCEVWIKTWQFLKFSLQLKVCASKMRDWNQESRTRGPKSRVFVMGKWPRVFPDDEKGSHWSAARQQARKATWLGQSSRQTEGTRKIGDHEVIWYVCTSGRLADLPGGVCEKIINKSLENKVHKKRWGNYSS